MIRKFALQAVCLLMVLGFSLSAANAYQISVKQKPGKLRFGVVDEDSIYQAAGFQRGDIIKEINGKTVDDTTPITEVEKVVRRGGRITIERDGKIKRMKLKPMPENVLIDPEQEKAGKSSSP